jgi:hypothetical protein
MNRDVASIYFPLYKAEIEEFFDGQIQTVSDILPLRISVTLKSKKDLDSEWEEVKKDIFDNLEIACSYISIWYDNFKVNNALYSQLERKAILNVVKIANRLPLRKIEVEEYVYGRDSGSPWSDPENDIRKNCEINYYIKKGIKSEWILDYSQGFGEFLYAISIINKTVSDLYMIPFEFDPRNTSNLDDIVMFSADGHMFQFDHHYFEGKSIYGAAITDYWDDYNDDNIGKFSYVENYVFLYKKDEIVLFMNNFYMNAKKIISVSKLKSKHNITDVDIAIMSDKVIKWFKNNFPNAKSINTWSGYYNLENN